MDSMHDLILLLICNKVVSYAHDRHGVLTALLVDVKPQERNYDSGWTHKAAIDQYILLG